MINTLFGQRYRVTEKIGSGGMADVYKAVDETLGRSVAVKVMHQKYASDPNFTARFRQEAQAAANLSSPNIVNIYDWGQDGNNYYIVMEYVRGTDLKSLILQKTYLPSKQVAEIGAQVCRALSVAHGYDIIHRDIKPHNIMVTPDGSVKVMDFGIARAGNTSMTQTGSVLGTAHYVSPEQAQGKALTAASDLYSLGIVLYEAASGKLPFDAETPVAVALKQVNEQPLRPSQFNPHLDSRLEAIIGKALVKDPRSRYTSAKEMGADLRNLVNAITAEGVQNAETTVAPAVVGGQKEVDKTRVIPAVGGASGLSDGPNPHAITNPPEFRPVPEEKNNWWIWVLLVAALIAAIVGGYFMLNGNPFDKPSVPNVVNQTLEAATEMIVEAGYKLGEVDEAFDEKIEKGRVISQTPAAGANAEKGTGVKLTISLGPEMVVVPDIKNMSEKEARDLLQSLGLSANAQPAEFNEEVESGKVISQSPEAGEQVIKGAAVTYIPSKGVETGEVPNVVNKKQADAIALLKTAGFGATVEEQFSATVAKGNVISQNPAGGITTNKGTKVTIVVSKGVELVKVPDVIALPWKAAVTTLENSGFKVKILYDPHSETGNVLEQDPQGDEKLPRGSTVSILVDLPQP